METNALTGKGPGCLLVFFAILTIIGGLATIASDGNTQLYVGLATIFPAGFTILVLGFHIWNPKSSS